MNAKDLFEAELKKRGFDFEIESESGRHAVNAGGTTFLVSLENLARDLEREGDPAAVSRFVDSIERAASQDDADYALEKADFREPLSDRVDKVLVHVSSDGNRIAWVNEEMLGKLNVSLEEASAIGLRNLSNYLAAATIDHSEIDGVRLAMIETTLPFKAAFVIAPNLRQLVERTIGWPIVAVTPNRDFLYLWAAKHTDFVNRVGEVVVREFKGASYPITPEVFEISDDGIEAIGEFPV